MPIHRFSSHPPTSLRRPFVWTALLVAATLTCPAPPNAGANDDKPAEFYEPIEKQVEGWTIKLDPRLLAPKNKAIGERALKALANHLQRIEYIVPEERVAQLRKLPIWMELNNPKLNNMQYHPGRRWLTNNGHDPKLVKHVHIPRAEALLSRSTWAKHPYVVLHELAHAYHDQILSFDHPRIVETFRKAQREKLYEDVLLFTGGNVRHYALTNHKEFFAEMTEAYFGVNDFYPFVRAELKKHDAATFALMQEIWGKIP